MNPFLIDRLSLRQLGPFESLDLEFGRCTDPDKADVHLFVGPNGSGKTTILSAIAGCLSGANEAENIQRRRGEGAAAGLWLPDWVTGFSGTDDPASEVASEFTGGRFGPVLFSRRVQLHLLPQGYRIVYWSTDGKQVDRMTRLDTLRDRAVRFEFGLPFSAFAYSGARRVSGGTVQSVLDAGPGKLTRDLEFDKGDEAPQFLQWVANAHTKAALARADGSVAEADQHLFALQAAERCVSEVTGAEVTFRLRRQPLAVVLRMDGAEVDFDVLPEGVRSILAWLGDLLMRLDATLWATPGDITRQPFLLLLDEVEVHLHPIWQRRLLPAVQRLFPNAQIIASTHSPFVVGSVSDAWIYPLALEKGLARALPRLPAQQGRTWSAVLRDVFEIKVEFDVETEAMLGDFYALMARRRAGDASVEADIAAAAQTLADRSDELGDLVARELRQLTRQTSKPA